MKFGYTIIQHEPRIDLGLNMHEYCVGDMVYHLSVNPSAPIAGWCNMSKAHMAEFLGITRSTVIRIINKLEDGDLIQRSPDGNYLRSTEKWVDKVVNFYERKTHDTGCSKMRHPLYQNATPGCSKMRHYNNIDNNKEKDGVPAILDEIKIENPVLYGTLLESESFQENIIRLLESENLKADFHSDVVPVIHQWLKNNWAGGGLKGTTGKLAAQCTAYVKSVIQAGGLKKGGSKAGGSQQEEKLVWKPFTPNN